MFPTCLFFEEAAARPPLPESLLTESATDLDAEEAGELELEANYAAVGARSGGARATYTSVEVEWRALREVGLRLEPSYARVVDPGGPPGRDDFGFAGVLAFGVLHDFARDLHLQAELGARTYLAADTRAFEPGESELPYSADLLAAARRGPFTLRVTVGAEAGGEFAHAPLHTDAALLVPWTGDGRFGFFGIEARADWARPAPLVLAPDIVALTTPLGLPFSLSLALPVNLGASAHDASYGFFLRLMLMTGREAEYGQREPNE